MRRFLQLLGVGLKTSIILSAAFIALWFVLDLVYVVFRLIPAGQKLLDLFFASSLGHVIGFYLYGGLYLFCALSIPLGQIYSFCFFSRRQKKQEANG